MKGTIVTSILTNQKLVKRYILQVFQAAVNFLLHNLG